MLGQGRRRRSGKGERMNIVLTGASGFVGQALIPKLLEKGHKIYALSRHPPAEAENLIPLTGDITLPNLGLENPPRDVDCVYHLAGIHSLRLADKNNEIHNTNVVGTKNILDFCVKYGVKRLVFTSTAYSFGWEDVNPYARSKVQNEKDIAEYAEKYGLSAIILRPSVVMGEESMPYKGHFGQFVLMVTKLHRGPEQVRRVVERVLRLPLLRPVFRIPGDPHVSLNMIRIGDVIQALIDIEKPGSYWVVNDSLPTLQELGEWVGEIIGVDMKFLTEKFKPSVIEYIFQRKGVAFTPYLRGDNFTSLASIKATPVDKQFIQNTVRNLLKA